MKIFESCHTKLTLSHLASETAKKLYYYVQWAGHFDCKEDFYIKRSHMKSLLLIYTVRGQGRLSYRGQTLSVPKNSLLLLDCTQPHEYHPDGAVWEFKYVHFFGQSSKKFHDHLLELYGSPVFPEQSDTEPYFDTILRLVKQAEGEEICSDLLHRILIHLISRHQPATDTGWISTALSYISEHYAGNLSVPQLAAQVHLSRCYFSTQFKKHTGFSPHGYLLHFRLLVAQQLLHNTSDSIETIAAKCGFSDPSTFIRAFQRQEGLSPFAYRKKKQ